MEGRQGRVMGEGKGVLTGTTPSSMRSKGLDVADDDDDDDDVVDPFSEVGEARTPPPDVSSVWPIVYVLYRRGRFMGIVSPVVKDWYSSCGRVVEGDGDDDVASGRWWCDVVVIVVVVVIVPMVRRCCGGLARRGWNVYSICLW